MSGYWTPTDCEEVMCESEICICRGGDFMPTELDFSCGCFMPPWLPEGEWISQDGCDHPLEEFELVCRVHLKHFPCRHCD